MKFSDFPVHLRGSGAKVRTSVRWLRARDVARVAVVTALCTALTFLGAGPALATGSESSPVAQDQIDPAQHIEVPSEPESTKPQALDSASSHPQTPVAEPAAPDPVSPEPTTAPPASSVEVVPESPERSEAQPQALPAGVDQQVPPYVYWDVVDHSGNPVSGATFQFERRTSGWWGDEWGGRLTVADCVAGTCAGVDRDSGQGAFLVKWINKDKPGANPGSDALAIAADTRYRLRPVMPPAGYAWAAGTDWVDSSTKNWAGAAGSRTLDFGAFVVTKVNYAPSCVAGYVYGIQSSGQIRQLSPNGAVTNLGGEWGRPSADFNGLGIGSGGSPVYAYSRSSNNNNSVDVASIYEYDTGVGAWAATNVAIDSRDGVDGGSVSFVAGAVNLNTGNYFLGGYRGDGEQRIFRLWEYDPATESTSYKGAIKAAGEGLANGDIAFDANGNLFVIQGIGTSTTVYSVTAEDLATAHGANIPSAATNAVKQTTDSVNGVAFDADGKGFLSGASDVEKYDMPGWTAKSTVTSGLGGSMDLASCSSPPTITIEKVIEGGRVSVTDQFALTLKQRATTISTATTTGNSSGVQPGRIGPLPTVRNVPLTFTETAAGTTNMKDYVSSYRCLVDGVQASQGNGTSGEVTIPAGGQAVNCQFYNAPLVAQVTVHKDVTDAQGENPTPKAGWTVGATAAATSTGSVTGMSGNPAKSTATNAAGDATWRYRFTGKQDSATITVFEEESEGYVFQRGSCVVTHLDGTTGTQELSGPAEQAITGIVPGDRVDCTYVNKLQPNELTLIKEVSNTHGGVGAAADWTLTATGPTQAVTGVTGDAAVTKAAVEAGEYALAEHGGPQGYVASAWVCMDGDDTLDTAGARVRVPAGANVVCTITNSDLPGSVSWSKVETGTTDLLGGSAWTLTGPAGTGSTVTTVEIEDCVAGDCANLQDQDPAAGKFRLEGLAWGSYQLREAKAPLGYLLDADTSHAFVVGGEGLEITLDAITNDPVTPPVIPLTGGFGSELYTFLGLGVLALTATAIGGARIRRRRA